MTQAAADVGKSVGAERTLGYRPALDGVRALAVLLVVAVHATYVLVPEWAGRGVPGGFLGVDVFFVLSGFLITSLLLQEHHRNGRISSRRFYARRALRLLPAVAVLLVVHAAIAVYLRWDLGLEAQSAAAVAFYGANWMIASGHAVSAGLGHLWSLSIEEQFYLVWPLFLVVALRRRRPEVVIVAVAVVGITWATGIRAWLWLHGATWEQVYVRTDARMDELLIGALLAVAFVRGWRLPARSRELGWLGVAVLLTCAFFVPRESDWLYVGGGFTVVGIAAALLIASLLDADWTLGRAFASKPAVTVGVVSYSLYLWHLPVFVVVAKLFAGQPALVRLCLGLAGTAAATVCSYRLVEMPFLRLKRRFSRYPPPASSSSESGETHPVPDVDARRMIGEPTISPPPLPGIDGAPEHPVLRGFAHGVGWSYVTLFSTGLATLFIAGWALRRVGAAGFGVYSLATSLAALLAIFDYAMGLAVMHAAARARGSDDRHAQAEGRSVVHSANGAFAMTGVAALVVSAIATVGLTLAGYSPVPNTAVTIGLLGIATAISLGTSALPAMLIAYQRFSLRAGATVAGVAVRIVVVLAATGPLGLAALGLAQLLGTCTERLIMVVLLRRAVPWFMARPRLPKRVELRQVTSFALPLVVINVSAQLFTLSDLVVVGAFAGSTAVGLYQVGTLIPMYVLAILLTGYNVVLPALIRTNDRARQEEATTFLTTVSCYVGAVVLVLLALLRRDVVDIILGGPSPLAEGVVLAFCGMTLANLMVHGSAWLLIARGNQALIAKAVAIELPLNLALTISLVWIHGAIGAAAATLGTVVVMDLIILPLVTRGQFRQPVLEVVMRNGLAPAALGAVVALGAFEVASVASGSTQRTALAIVMAGVVGPLVGLVFAGSTGRRSLREAFTRSTVSSEAIQPEAVVGQ